MQISDWIALVALVFSIISLYISWLAYYRDRSHLQLTIDFHGESTANGKYHITITNDGRRPITLSEVAARFWCRKHRVFYEKETPLNEGETKLVLAPIQLFPVKHPLSIMVFEAKDSTGKKYRVATIWLIWQILSTWEPKVK